MIRPYVATKTLEELTAEGFMDESLITSQYPDDEVLCYREVSIEGDILKKPLEVVTGLKYDDLQEVYKKFTFDGVRFNIVTGDNIMAKSPLIRVISFCR